MTSRDIDYVDQLLNDIDWKRRREAALTLGYADRDGAKEALVTALDDVDSAVRQAAVISLGRIGGADVVDELSKPKILIAEDPDLRRTVVSVLGRIGGLKTVDPLASAIGDRDWTVRSEAVTRVQGLIDWLSELRVPETARLLVRMLPVDVPEVREKTIRALGEFGRVAVSVLEDSLGVRSELVRSGACAALGLIADPATIPALVRLLTDPSRQVRLSAIVALGNIPSVRSVAPLIEQLSDPDPRIRSGAIESLGRIGPLAVEPLIEELEHLRTEESIASALKALAALEDERALVQIMNHLGHTYMTVRWAAVGAAASYGDRALPLLIEMLAQNRVPVQPLVEDALNNRLKRNRLRTIRALGELKDSRAVSALKKIAQEPDREIREAAEEALKRIGSATWARASAVKALGQIGRREAVPSIVERLDDPNSTVRLRAARSLKAIGDPSAAGPLAGLLERETDEEIREETVAALGTLGMGKRVAVAACTDALSDPSRSVRSRAARSLGRLGSKKAVEPLVRALGDGYWSVRRDAENSLINLGAKALASVIEALSSDRFAVRFRAARILGSIGGRRAVRPLREALAQEREEEVREVMAAALDRLAKPAP
jgi:HEAT repeat protein